MSIIQWITTIQTATDLRCIESAKERIRFLATTNEYSPRAWDRLASNKGNGRRESVSPHRQRPHAKSAIALNGTRAISHDNIRRQISDDPYERMEIPPLSPNSPARIRSHDSSTHDMDQSHIFQEREREESDISDLSAPSGQSSWYHAQEDLLDADDIFNQACKYLSPTSSFLGAGIRFERHENCAKNDHV
jgi:hypothetical protein